MAKDTGWALVSAYYSALVRENGLVRVIVIYLLVLVVVLAAPILEYLEHPTYLQSRYRLPVIMNSAALLIIFPIDLFMRIRRFKRNDHQMEK